MITFSFIKKKKVERKVYRGGREKRIPSERT